MKKVLTFILICTLILSFSSVAFADEAIEETATEMVEETQTQEEPEQNPAEMPAPEAETESARDDDGLISQVYAYAATLYYCDTPTNRVVLKNITPAYGQKEALLIAKSAEYLEIKLSADGIFMDDGTKSSVDQMNTYADRNVWVIIAQTKNGNLVIPYFQFK